MHREADVQLVHAVLSGDNSAFGILVEKYQKSIHTLIQQRIGDFHYAQDLTQETFFCAYRKLSTLKDPSRFSNWLYKIALNCCRNWLREQKRENQSQSLEDTPMAEVAQSNYDRYRSEQHEAEAAEHRRETVEKLLAKLPEGQRLVVTLHYLNEMKHAEIGKFLGITEEAVRTRLHRAKKRLQEEEELLIQEFLGGVQIPSSLKQNIMRKIADMKPTPSPPKMKPFLPWVAIGAALVVATVLILGVSNFRPQFMARFQDNYFANTAEAKKDAKDFDADWTLTLGPHTSGDALLGALLEEKYMLSRWSTQILENPDFPVVAAETAVDIVVVSMLELGFAEGELATLDTIYARARQMGFETCPIGVAPQLRLQFRKQPNYNTGKRLGAFFVASEPFFLTREGLPKIFSIVRDDRYPHPETSRGLWLIANGTVDLGNDEDFKRLFNASDPDGLDHGGRFAFVIPR